MLSGNFGNCFQVASNKISNDNQLRWWEIPSSICNRETIISLRIEQNVDSWSLILAHLVSLSSFLPNARFWPLLMWKSNGCIHRLTYFIMWHLTEVFAFFNVILWDQNFRHKEKGSSWCLSKLWHGDFHVLRLLTILY